MQGAARCGVWLISLDGWALGAKAVNIRELRVVERPELVVANGLSTTPMGVSPQGRRLREEVGSEVAHLQSGTPAMAGGIRGRRQRLGFTACSSSVGDPGDGGCHLKTGGVARYPRPAAAHRTKVDRGRGGVPWRRLEEGGAIVGAWCGGRRKVVGGGGE